jgi:imidazoleglycerol phosphate dehydratase HisB
LVQAKAKAKAEAEDAGLDLGHAVQVAAAAESGVGRFATSRYHSRLDLKVGMFADNRHYDK